MDPQVAIQLHWIAEAIFKLAKAVDHIGLTFIIIGWFYLLFKD